MLVRTMNGLRVVLTLDMINQSVAVELDCYRCRTTRILSSSQLFLFKPLNSEVN